MGMRILGLATALMLAWSSDCFAGVRHLLRVGTNSTDWTMGDPIAPAGAPGPWYDPFELSHGLEVTPPFPEGISYIYHDIPLQFNPAQDILSSVDAPDLTQVAASWGVDALAVPDGIPVFLMNYEIPEVVPGSISATLRIISDYDVSVYVNGFTGTTNFGSPHSLENATASVQFDPDCLHGPDNDYCLNWHTDTLFSGLAIDQYYNWVEGGSNLLLVYVRNPEGEESHPGGFALVMDIYGTPIPEPGALWGLALIAGLVGGRRSGRGTASSQARLVDARPGRAD